MECEAFTRKKRRKFNEDQTELSTQCLVWFSLVFFVIKTDLAGLGGPCDLCIHAPRLVPGGIVQAEFAPGWSWVDTLGDPANGGKHWPGRGPETSGTAVDGPTQTKP